MTSNTYSFNQALKAENSNVPANLDFEQPFVPQIQKILVSAGSGLREATEITLSGQPVAAILMAAGLEMLIGLPNITLSVFATGGGLNRVGSLELGNWRHNVVRVQRDQVPQGEASKGYTVLDGRGQGLTEAQRDEIAEQLNIAPEDIRVVDFNAGQVDFTDPTQGVVEKLLRCGLTVADWAARRILYLPAGSGLAAVIQATAIHGLGESWPQTIRLSNVGHADKSFHVAEIVDPQAMRQWGVGVNAQWATDQTIAVLEALVTELEEKGISPKVEGTQVLFEIGGKTFKLSVSSAQLLE